MPAVRKAYNQRKSTRTREDIDLGLEDIIEDPGGFGAPTTVSGATRLISYR
eukprot:gene31479-6666_t